ncbi:hypothetical protein ACOSP7_005313 [Xanthoceras sorbifolium]
MAPAEWNLHLINDWDRDAILGKEKDDTPLEVAGPSGARDVDEVDVAPEKDKEVATEAVEDVILDDKE